MPFCLKRQHLKKKKRKGNKHFLQLSFTREERDWKGTSVVPARTSDMCSNSYAESQPRIISKEQINNDTLSSGTSPFLNSSAKISQTNSCTNQGSQACAHWQGAGLFPEILCLFLFVQGFVLIALPRQQQTGPLTPLAFVPAPSLPCGS